MMSSGPSRNKHSQKQRDVGADRSDRGRASHVDTITPQHRPHSVDPDRTVPPPAPAAPFSESSSNAPVYSTSRASEAPYPDAYNDYSSPTYPAVANNNSYEAVPVNPRSQQQSEQLWIEVNKHDAVALEGSKALSFVSDDLARTIKDKYQHARDKVAYVDPNRERHTTKEYITATLGVRGSPTDFECVLYVLPKKCKAERTVVLGTNIRPYILKLKAESYTYPAEPKTSTANYYYPASSSSTAYSSTPPAPKLQSSYVVSTDASQSQAPYYDTSASTSGYNYNSSVDLQESGSDYHSPRADSYGTGQPADYYTTSDSKRSSGDIHYGQYM